MEANMEQGLIHIYCGDGKGKTTACMGLAVRCAGTNHKVLIVQFLKSRPTGELNSLKFIPNIEILRGKATAKFTFQMNAEEKKQVLAEHNLLFDKVLEKCAKEAIDLLILDEVIGACRNPHQELMELADYISEIKKIKHPYDKGIPARTGIER